MTGLDWPIAFCGDAFSLDLNARHGDRAAFLSAGLWHHRAYHFTIHYPERLDVAPALKWLYDHGWGIDGAKDHGAHQAIDLHTPDGDEIELA